MRQRPIGITLLGALVLGSAAYLVGAGILAALDRVPLSAGAPLLNGFEQMGPPIFVIGASALALTAFGLLRLHRWARRAAIAFAAWVLASSIPGVSSAVITWRWAALILHGAIIIGSVVAIRYLMDAPVRAAFEATGSDA